jgi:hypothetical protein
VALQAYNSPRIATIKKEGAEKRLKASIERCFVLMGHKFEVSQLIIFIDCLWDELKKNQSFYTLEEIDLALEMGAKGKLVDLTKIPQPVVSLSNFLLFIRLYNEKIRREMLNKEKIEKEKQEKFISDKEREEKIKLFENEIANVYQYFIDNLELPELSIGLRATYYRALDANKLVELSVELKKELYERAKQEIKTVVDLRVYNDVEKAFNKNKKEKEIIEIAQAMALEFLFAEYLKQSITLK